MVVSDIQRTGGAVRERREILEGVHLAHGAEVQRFIHGLRLGLTREQVEDAVQEVYVRLLGKESKFDPARGSMKAYVLGIARYVAIDLCRAHRHSSLASEPAGEDPPSALERGEQRRLVSEALSALEPEERALLTLRHVNQLEMRELADSNDCSLPTLRKRLAAAARRFGVELRQRGVLDAPAEAR